MARSGFSFSSWDGTQNPWGDSADTAFDQLSEDVFHGVNVESALRRLLARGWGDASGAAFQGLEELMERLRQERQRQLERYNLNGVFDDLAEKLDSVLRREREGLAARLQAAAEGDSGRLVTRVVEAHRAQLDGLPPEPSGVLRQLREYEFLDSDAEQAFRALLEEIDSSISSTYFSAMAEQLQQTSPADVARMRDMARALNSLVQQRLEGAPEDQQQANYRSFLENFGDLFPGAPEKFSDFLEQLQQRMSRLDSLMQSLSLEQRSQLADLASQAFGDGALQTELAELMAGLELLSPRQRLGSRQGFFGDEPVSLDEAMRLMGRMQSLEQMERALRGAYRGEALTDTQRGELGELLGPDALASLDRVSDLMATLQHRGLIEQTDDGVRLTARGVRRIGHKAVRDLFAHLDPGRLGDHAHPRSGAGLERGDESKPFEFGDPFDLDVAATVNAAVHRRAQHPDDPRLMSHDDFHVYRREAQTRAATVLLLDMSRSMPLRGYFYAAKKVAVALDSLIRSQYPRDALSVIGFSDYAREIEPRALAQLSVNEYVYGTNLHHGLILARRFLARHRNAQKQVIIVSDGEPTAHLENGHAVFYYPPLAETFHKTLVEVRRCTAEDIIINTFMLESNRHLVEFVNQMTRLNRGRTFFISPDRLGDYILVDYVNGRRRAA